MGYPDNKVVIKPWLSNGLRGLRIITKDVLSLDKFLNEKPSGLEINLRSLLEVLQQVRFPELLVEEYLPGDEYTVDIFRNSMGIVG